MARQRRLNIFNSDRIHNLNLTTKQEEANFTKVTRLNEKKIEQEMDQLKEKSTRFNKRNKKRYLIYKERYGNDTVQDKIFNHGGYISYYTTDRIPIPVIGRLAAIPQSEAIFLCKKDFSLEEVRNVHLASMATKVTIDVPIVLPDMNVYDYLFSLYPLRYHVDKVNISFPALSEKEIQERHKPFYIFYNGMYHLKAIYKYQCFQYLREPLSTWKMNIWLVCDSKQDLHKVEEMVRKDNKRFESGYPKEAN